MAEQKFVITVSESGLHMVVDDILTPTEALKLIQEIREALFNWAKMTGRFIDSGKKHGMEVK